MAREIKLDGGEVTVLKTIGFGGTPLAGKLLALRVGGMGSAELATTLNGLIEMEYVISNTVNIRVIEDVEKAAFRVNPAYARELRNAVHPGMMREQTRARRERRR